MSLLLLLACEPEVATFCGVFRDARTEAPVVGVVVRAEAESAECVALSAPTNAAGEFEVSVRCVGDTYHLLPADPSWWVPQPATAEASQTLAAWRAPPTSGFYAVVGTELHPLLSNTQLATIRLGDQEASYPLTLPGDAPNLAAADALLVAGDLPAWQVDAVIPSPALVVQTPDGPAAFDAWHTLGAEATSEGALLPRPVSLEGREVAGARGDGAPASLTVLSAADLSPGRYALRAEGAARAAIFNRAP